MSVTFKRWFVFLCVVTTLLGCKSSDKSSVKAKNNNPPVETVDTDKTKNEVSIYFHVVYPYCGGAAPSEEMETLRMKGEPYAGKDWYIGTDVSNCQKFTTDENGFIRVSLTSGKYQIYSTYKVESEQIFRWKKTWKFNAECLSQHLANPDYTFEVNQDFSAFEFTVMPRCSYEGPIPCITNPQAPPP